MTVSGEEARDRALQKVGELRQISNELCAILGEIPLPTPEEFEAMRSRRMPWTLEAYIAALIREADFNVDQARELLEDYGSEDAESLKQFWAECQPFGPNLERSLRYLVEGRFGTEEAPLYEATL
jgi:hypothetical protein